MLGNTTFVKLALLLLPLSVAGSTPADADQFVCAPADLVECDPDLFCGAPAPELPPPTFFHVDLDERVITLLAPP
ncbi:MAG: hypothetical protein PVJ43_09860 [Gemmatimonadales bacterium]